MTTGFLSAGQCLSTFDEAADAHWSRVSPVVGDGFYSQVIKQAGYWLLDMHTRDPNTNLITVRSMATVSTPSFPECDLPAEFSPGVAGSLFTLFFGLVLSSYFVSKNAGLILNAIRRW